MFQKASSVQVVRGKEFVSARENARVVRHDVGMQLETGKLASLFTRACEAPLKEKEECTDDVAVTEDVLIELSLWEGLPKETLNTPFAWLAHMAAMKV